MVPLVVQADIDWEYALAGYVTRRPKCQEDDVANTMHRKQLVDDTRVDEERLLPVREWPVSKRLDVRAARTLTKAFLLSQKSPAGLSGPGSSTA
mgnify:FL=1